MTPYELQLVPTAELITELMQRYTHAVFAGIIEREDEHIRTRRWRGNLHTGVGLSVSLSHAMLDAYDAHEKPSDPKDL